MTSNTLRRLELERAMAADAEIKRSNLAREAETHRANRFSETQKEHENMARYGALDYMVTQPDQVLQPDFNPAMGFKLGKDLWSSILSPFKISVKI